MATTTRSRATVEDFERLEPETMAELIDGEIIREPAPGYRHQRVVGTMTSALDTYARNAGGTVLCGPFDVELGPHDVYQPDVLFVVDEHRGIIGEQKIVGAPDLVVEVLSPSTRQYDLRTKKLVYERAGVREYWIVDPIAETVEVFANGSRGFVLSQSVVREGELRSTVLADFSMSATEVFRT